MLQHYICIAVCNNLLIFLAFFLILLFTPSLLVTFSSKLNNLTKFFLEMCVTTFPCRTLPSHLTSRVFIFTAYAGCFSFSKKCSYSPVWGTVNSLQLVRCCIPSSASCLHLFCSSLAAMHRLLSSASESVYGAISFVLVALHLWPFAKVFFAAGLFSAGIDSATESHSGHYCEREVSCSNTSKPQELRIIITFWSPSQPVARLKKLNPTQKHTKQNSIS